MRVAVVIVTYNSSADLPALLGSIPDRVGEHAIDVVVVDSGSSDDSLAVARVERPAVRTVDLGANRGYAAGVNAGWEAAVGADAMLLLNPDLTVDEGALEPWLAALDADGGIVAPRIRNLSGALEPSLRRRPSVLRSLAEGIVGGRLAGRLGIGELITDPAVYESPATASWVSGAAMAVSADCLAEVGRWEERLFLYSEETDFCLRAGAAGHGVRYEPEATIVHRGGDFEASTPLYSLLTWNRVRVHRARTGVVRANAMRIAVSVGEAIRAVAGSHRDVHRGALLSLWSPSRRRSLLPPESHFDWHGAR
jgi:N-acetylglucosaminyl-diphospho-decaprenol L-rhamnosyltransferase